MQILVACEESQAVTIALRKLGHEAYSCDLIPCSGGHPEWHIQQDVLPLLNGYCFFKTCDGSAHYVLGRWDMLISFENRGATALHPGNTAVAVWTPIHKADMPVAQRAAPAGPHRNHHGGCHPMGKWRMQRRTWELPALSRPQRTGPHQQGQNFPRHSRRNGGTMGRARDYLIISPPLFAEAGRGRLHAIQA